MRVAVDANCLAWGWSGIPKHVDRIARELAGNGDVELTLLANSRRPFTDIPGARQVYRRLKGGPLWRHAFLLPWLARSRQDVLWAPETITPVWSPVPTVVTVHDLATVMFGAIKPRREEIAHRTAVRRSVRTASRVIAVSQATAHDLRRRWGVDERIIRVVPNGIDSTFTPGDRAAATAEVAQRWGVDAPYVLFVGTLEPRKGLDVLIEAAALARHWRLVLVGAVGFRGDDYAAAARERAGAALLGPVPDDALPDLYRAAEVLAAPSLYEGFGLTPIEAMACGTPAVVAGGSGGLVEVAGESAVVVSERSPTAWVDAIEAARHRRAELVQRGLTTARAFSWPVVANSVRAVFEEAARGRERERHGSA